ncbi:hypothetical protein G7Z17_g8421 [Cylindrodendrum hubeiense]|uniref:Azaphilone pigments biosynthesis cluster protein L N-terminal domain-containing protein n=1 Tax=Cylindrodendrum hubeiense TaxID=595255 RepID=A0A9P5H738_9HYPO|nr:hypothetical protein G7Z17_g8421 [Cylindrodendrum hubeiense]
MDPFSIAGTSIALAGTIATLGTSLTAFIRDVRDARRDIEDISLELHSLKMVLELIADDSISPMPSTVQTQLDGALSNCARLVGDIDRCIQQHRGSRVQKGLRWVTVGRGDMTRLRSALETHKTTLNLLLEKINQTKLHEVNDATLEIKTSTEALLQNTRAIKTDTLRILEVVESLADMYAGLFADAARDTRACMLQRYLDETTTYAETVVDEPTKRIMAEDHNTYKSLQPQSGVGSYAMQC